MEINMMHLNLFIFNFKEETVHKILKVIFFIGIFSCIFFGVTENLFKRRTPIVDYVYNKAPKNSIDLLFVGSSHSYLGFNTKIFDNSFNINSYNFATGAQSIEGSYYAIMEILKKQSPKIIVLEAFSLYLESEKDKKSNPNTNNLVSDMKLSENKIKFVWNNFYKKDLLFYLFNTLTYHELWKEMPILKKNFASDYPSYKGFSGYSYDYTREVLDYEVYEKGYKDEYNISFPKKNLEYLEKLAKILNERNIKLILVSNVVVPKDRQCKVKYFIEKNKEIHLISKKYDMKILDFNNGEMKLEKMQFLDNGHLSLAGTDIVSEKVVDFISREYPGIFPNNILMVKDKSPEYFFYNKYAQKNDELFKVFPVNIILEKNIKIIRVYLYKKQRDLFDLYLELDNKELAYELNNQFENSIMILDKEIKFKERIVKEPGQNINIIYPKYYLREINGKIYIYLKNFSQNVSVL